MTLHQNSRLPTWFTAVAAIGTFAVLVWFERRRPLRRATEPKLQRNVKNLGAAILGAIALQTTEAPIVRRMTRAVERNRWGLLKRYRLPRWLEAILAVVLMDYTLYVWHVLAHRVPFLWSLHAWHHEDRDLDASTALRFHFAELVLSTPWRTAQICVIGVSPLSLSIWQTFLMMSILFHHSNINIPPEAERRVGMFVVTPRMHGIHHSVVESERNSNWSSGLVVWDILHGTRRLDVDQDEIVIGL